MDAYTGSPMKAAWTPRTPSALAAWSPHNASDPDVPYRSDSHYLERSESAEFDDALQLAILPWLAFSFVLSLFVFAFEEYGPLVWGLVFFTAMLGLLAVALGMTGRRTAHFVLGCFLIASVMAAIPLGMYIESGFMDEYWRLQFGASYDHLQPQESGASYLDATTLQFGKSAFLDVKRALGFMKGGHLVCVAPVYGKGMTSSPHFWATGWGCCEPRGSFNCPGYKEELQAGVVVDDSSGIFKKAVRMAQSVHGLEVLPKSHVVLLSWMADPDSYKQSLWWSAMTSVALAVAADLALACSAGFFAARCIATKQPQP
eukprot:TRINITY_DN9862_c3_g1_i1.p1 TRINITY_DN9862_c3_g1~~TRINITY_DN9862_c3_g1_i1.p1  ORF type:complete len:315 (+),score=61.22 TRINITY_DN9862_c3_g1_i1:67-1011(+)